MATVENKTYNNYAIPDRGELIYEFILWCEIQPLERPRISNGRVYQPIDNQKQLINELLRYSQQGSQIYVNGIKKLVNTPVIVDQFYYFDKRGREYRHPTVLQLGDEDNLRKGVNDALVKASILDDDKNIVGGQQYKIWDRESYVVVRIYGVKDAYIHLSLCEMQ